MEMTAAHPTLPFGTKLRVTDVASGKSGTVRINDRGPVAMVCQCTPVRYIRASKGVALGPVIRCDKCGKPFRIVPGQRVSEADRR